MGLGYFDSETAASSTFGSVVCLAGILGTPLGGFLLDHRLYSVKTKEIPVIDEVSDVESVILEQECVVSDAAQKGGEKDTNPIASPNALKCVTEIATIGTFLGAILLCSVYFIHNRFLYLLLVTLGCLLIFLCSPSVNIGIMMAVPDDNRYIRTYLPKDIPKDININLSRKNCTLVSHGYRYFCSFADHLPSH